MSGLSQPRQLFGVHSFTPYSRTDGTFYGILKCLESSAVNLSGSQIELHAGSLKYSWASETGQITGEMSLKFSEYPDFLFTILLGKAPTQTTSETAGNISTLTNVYGTSVMNATTGIASVLVIPSTGAANLKFGKYIVKAITATTVKVYASSDIDFARGTAETFDGDDLNLTDSSSALAIATTTALNITNIGVKLTGGSGTIGMTAGDTASFEIRPVNSKASVVTIGGASDVFPEFGAIVVAQYRGTNEMYEIDAYRCKASGMNVPFDMFAWAKSDVKVKMLYDSTKNAVFKSRYVAI